MIVYRGDNRTPAQVKAAGGFSAWKPASLEEARRDVQRLFATNPVDIQMHVIANPGTYVATDLDPAGDADTRGSHTYQITVDGLQEVPRVNLAAALGVTLTKTPNMLWPKLYLNEPGSLALSTVIAVQPARTTELVFFTAVPLSMVTGCKVSAAASFAAL